MTMKNEALEDKVIERILKSEYSDYEKNKWHYHREYAMLLKAYKAGMLEMLEIARASQPVVDTEANEVLPDVSNRICCQNCKVLHVFPSGKYRCEKNYIEIKEDITTHSCNYFSDLLS